MKRNRKTTILSILIGLAVGVWLFNTANTYLNISSLIEHFVDSFIDKSENNETPIHKAARRGNLTEIQRLIDTGIDPDIKDERGRTPLHIAATHGRTEALKLLSKHGADIEARDNKGYSPLFLAVWNNKVSAIEWLISAGAEVDGENGEHAITALFVAAQMGHENAAKALLKHGADVNFKISGFPQTPLLMTVIKDKIKVAEILLVNGANVNERDSDSGMTALYITKVAGNRKMASLLLANGADSGIADNFGQNAEQTAAIMKLSEDRELLAAKGSQEVFDRFAIVRLFYHRVTQEALSFNGLRIAFVIGDGSYIVTAAHCIKDMTQDTRKGILIKPRVFSRYYGDIFEAEIIAVDDQADIAILQVAWNSHPTLELATTEEVLQAKEIIIAGYPPSFDERFRKKSYRDVFMEQLPVVKFDRQAGPEAIVLGCGKFAGPGWSGSPMILPGSGKVAGVFGRHVLRQAGEKVLLHNLMGADVESIHSLLETNGIHVSGTHERGLADRKPDADKVFWVFLDCLDELGKKDMPLALSKARELVILRKDSVDFRLLLASLAESSKNTDEDAIELAELSHKKALKFSHNSFVTHARYGNFLLRNERNDEALNEFKKAIEIEPDNSFVLLKLIKMLKIPDANEAEIFARRLVENYPENPGYWFELSTILDKTGKFDEEVETAKKAISLNENVPYQYRRRLADALVHAKKLDEAEACFKLLLEEHECARCWLAYARLLIKFESDRYDDALKAIEKIQSTNQDQLISPDTIEELHKTLLKNNPLKEPNTKIAL